MFKLNHVALTVADREKSALFYGAFFGLVNRVYEDAHLLIQAGPDGSLLALSEEVVPPAPVRTTYFGFEAVSPQVVRNVCAAFRAEGVREAEWQKTGPVRVQVFDPDGYRVEACAWGWADWTPVVR